MENKVVYRVEFDCRSFTVAASSKDEAVRIAERNVYNHLLLELDEEGVHEDDADYKK